MGMQVAGTSIPMNVQPSLVQPYMLNAQPTYPTIVASGNQPVQQPGSISVSRMVADGVQLGSDGQQMVQQGLTGGQRDGGGPTNSSGSGCSTGSQPRVAN